MDALTLATTDEIINELLRRKNLNFVLWASGWKNGVLAYNRLAFSDTISKDDAVKGFREAARFLRSS